MRVAVEGEDTLVIGGETYVVSPLTLAQVKRAKPLLAALALENDDSVDAAAELISMGLIHRQPEMNAEKVTELLAFRDLLPAIDKVLIVGGLKPAGEAGAGQGAN